MNCASARKQQEMILNSDQLDANEWVIINNDEKIGYVYAYDTETHTAVVDERSPLCKTEIVFDKLKNKYTIYLPNSYAYKLGTLNFVEDHEEQEK